MEQCLCWARWLAQPRHCLKDCFDCSRNRTAYFDPIAPVHIEPDTVPLGTDTSQAACWLYCWAADGGLPQWVDCCGATWRAMLIWHSQGMLPRSGSWLQRRPWLRPRLAHAFLITVVFSFLPGRFKQFGLLKSLTRDDTARQLQATASATFKLFFAEVSLPYEDAHTRARHPTSAILAEKLPVPEGPST